MLHLNDALLKILLLAFALPALAGAAGHDPAVPLGQADLVFAPATAETAPRLQEARGRIALQRASLAELERDARLLRALGLPVTYLSYRPSDRTPATERRDPLAAVQAVHALARRHGARSMVVIDQRQPARAAQLARFADALTIELQGWQALPEGEFQTKALALISALRLDNPAVSLFLGLPAGAEALSGRLQALRPHVDGIGLALADSPEQSPAAALAVR